MHKLCKIGKMAAVVIAMAVSLCVHADEPEHYRDFTIKTNGVGWGFAMCNAAIEYQFAPQFSVELPAYYSCWDFPVGHNIKFRGFVMQPEVKYFFDRRQEWSVGLHVGFAYYNIALGGDYRFQTHDHCCPMGGGGVSLNYRWYYGKNKRWGVDFSIGIGAYLTEYDRYPTAACTCDPNDLSHYVNMRCDCQDPTFVRKAFIGIDKLSVSVTYTLDFLHKRK